MPLMMMTPMCLSVQTLSTLEPLLIIGYSPRAKDLTCLQGVALLLHIKGIYIFIIRIYYIYITLFK